MLPTGQLRRLPNNHMPKVTVYNLEGKSIGEEILNDKYFGVKVNRGLIEQVVTAILANARQVLGHTKTRAEVRGGGKKPWAQKHTGRARHGSIRSPIWKGGGIAFGPNSDRNFRKEINKTMKRKALLMSLSDKVANNALVLVDKLEMPEIKTKKFVAMMAKLPVKGSTLVVLKDSDQKLVKSARNLGNVKTLRADSLNVYDVLKHKYILASKDVIAVIEKTYKAK